MKLLVIVGLISLGANYSYASKYSEIVYPHEIECSTEDLGQSFLIEVNYYRTEGFGGPSTVFLNNEAGPSFSGGWKVSLAPENTRLSGMTEFALKGPGVTISLILNPSFNTGFGHAYFADELLLVSCKFN